MSAAMERANICFFEWEREWRKIGHYTFTTDEVEFLVIPKKLTTPHAAFSRTPRPRPGPCYAARSSIQSGP